MDRATQDDPSLTTVPDAAADTRVRTAIGIEDLRNAVVCEALAAWDRIRADRQMPSRAEMSPRVMRGFLKHMALIQVIDGGTDFRFRVVGDAVVIQQGMALNGVTTSISIRVFPATARSLRALIAAWCVTARRLPIAGYTTAPPIGTRSATRRSWRLWATTANPSII
jgi:hypothetical protein